MTFFQMQQLLEEHRRVLEQQRREIEQASHR